MSKAANPYAPILIALGWKHVHTHTTGAIAGRESWNRHFSGAKHGPIGADGRRYRTYGVGTWQTAGGNWRWESGFTDSGAGMSGSSVADLAKLLAGVIKRAGK